MSFFDPIIETAKSEGTVLAQDWLRSLANANRPQVQVAPQPQATLPAAAVQASNNMNNYVMYAAIGAAILGLIYLLMPSKKGKK
ncbi:MAG: hypothetical protein ACK41T_01075 [Pseudobdellovibrio sp.]